MEASPFIDASVLEVDDVEKLAACLRAQVRAPPDVAEQWVLENAYQTVPRELAVQRDELLTFLDAVTARHGVPRPRSASSGHR